MDKVKRTFGNSKVFNDVKANLYFQIYNAFPSRDDLGFLKINPKISASNPRAEKKMNYIYKRQGATNWTTNKILSRITNLTIQTRTTVLQNKYSYSNAVKRGINAFSTPLFILIN